MPALLKIGLLPEPLVAAMALLFRSTVDSAARWRDQLTKLSEAIDIRV